MKTIHRMILLGSGFAVFFMGCAQAPSPPTSTPIAPPTVRPTELPFAVDSFETCSTAGNPIMESYPQQCRAADGTVYMEDIGNELEKLDLILINTPRPNAVIRSPLQIEGEARGPWFFEADFPIELMDNKGEIIGTAIAQAQGEWMTEEFVPFTATLTFTKPAGCRGDLVLIKDNPSDLEELDDMLRVLVKFCPD